MRINYINNNQLNINYKNQKNSKSNTIKLINFNGLKGSGKAIFFLDLDGSFLQGLNHETLDKFLKLKKEANASSVYITGRNLFKFLEVKADLTKNGFDLPLPDEFLLTRNGLFMHNRDGDNLVENAEYTKRILDSFDEKAVMTSAQKFAFSLENVMPDFKGKVITDFNQSKLCTYDFLGAPGRMIQFVADASISNTVLNNLKNHLKKDKINAKVMMQTFSREVADSLCTPEQLAVINPRYNQGNKMYQIDILAANKGDAVEFIQAKSKIPDEEVLMAGNDDNDISMARLSKNSKRNFVCLDKTGDLFQYTSKLAGKDNVFMPQEEGIWGIIEAIKKILKDK